MNEIIKTIKERRAIRAFKDRPIEKEKIQQIIEAGTWAPSARNLQPWKFIIVTNRQLIKEMGVRIQEKVIGNARYSFVKERAKTNEDAIFYSAPLVIFIFGDENNKWSTIDCSLTAQNMMLAAHSLGIGSCPIGMARFVKDERDIIKELDFPEDYELVLTIAFGYPDEKPEPKERNKNVVKWVE